MMLPSAFAQLRGRHFLFCYATFLLSCSCAGRVGERPARLEPALHRVLETRPDTIVPVVVLMTRELEPADRAQLTGAGLAFGSYRNRIVTGTIRAGDAVKLAALPMVRWVELSSVLGVTR